MATELDTFSVPVTRPVHFEWILPMFLRPRRTLAKVAEQATASWLVPLLVLTVLSLVGILVAGPLRQIAATTGAQTLPPDFQYWSPEQQAQYQQTLASSSGPTFIYVFPAIAAIFKIWLGWFVLAGILHLVLTMAGSRSDLTHALNLTAWASLPLAIRSLVQIGAALFGRILIQNPGLSGFAPSEPTGIVRFLSAILPLIDLYLIWQIVLILVGLLPMPGMTARKAWICLLVSVVIVLLLSALPGFIGAQLSSMPAMQRFFF